MLYITKKHTRVALALDILVLIVVVFWLVRSFARWFAHSFAPVALPIAYLCMYTSSPLRYRVSTQMCWQHNAANAIDSVHDGERVNEMGTFLIAHQAKWRALLLPFDFNRFKASAQAARETEKECARANRKHTNSIHIHTLFFGASAMRFIWFAHIFHLVLAFLCMTCLSLWKHFVCFSFFSFNSFGSVFGSFVRWFALFVLGPFCVCSVAEWKNNFYGCALFARSLHDRATRNLQRTLSLCIRNRIGRVSERAVFVT